MTISVILRLPFTRILGLVIALLARSASIPASTDLRLTLHRLVTPSTPYFKDGQPVPFVLHGFIEFRTGKDLFGHIDGQAGKWTFDSEKARQEFADQLLRRGVESRLVSMVYEKPLELLLTHIAEDLKRAVTSLRTPAAPMMFEVWKVKYLQMRRFGDVIRSTRGVKLDHFLNDEDSPDIPIPVYVGFLNRIREEAVKRVRP